MKRIAAVLLALALLLGMAVGCSSRAFSQFESALEKAAGEDINAFFSTVEETCQLILGQEESIIDTDAWPAGVLGSTYQAGGFTVAGYDTTVALSVNSGFITGVDFNFKGISQEDFEAIAAAAEAALGEAERSGETIVMLLWSRASMIYQSGSSACEFLVY